MAILLIYVSFKCGPEYVCVRCHRMLYKSTVIPINVSKYKDDVLSCVAYESYKCTSVDDKEYLCRSCHNSMCRCEMPLQAKANGLDLDVIPDELKDLNTLELRLISLRIPFLRWLRCPVVNSILFMVLL